MHFLSLRHHPNTKRPLREYAADGICFDKPERVFTPRPSKKRNTATFLTHCWNPDQSKNGLFH